MPNYRALTVLLLLLLSSCPVYHSNEDTVSCIKEHEMPKEKEEQKIWGTKCEAHIRFDTRTSLVKEFRGSAVWRIALAVRDRCYIQATVT
ncbi:hypothetical protein CEXT_656391 [Caerostris extrusa]|uniref:Secreted protein n=1 Tax=Caerostris extrusa TaxID=172846 RepID=A0AAV4XQ80_CAEEX|nr:hypothetical protein CEXT_656391 [Caerostris extrusa]